MSKRSDHYQLKGRPEIDEELFERVYNNEDKPKPRTIDIKLKRSRGSERQSKLLVMAESKPSPARPKKGKPDRKLGHLKMKILEDLLSEYINQETKNGVDAS